MKSLTIILVLFIQGVGLSQASVVYINLEEITAHPSYAKFYDEMDSINLGLQKYVDSLTENYFKQMSSCNGIGDEVCDTLSPRHIMTLKRITTYDSLLAVTMVKYENNTNALIDNFQAHYACDLFIFRHKYGYTSIIDDPSEQLNLNYPDVTLLFLEYLNWKCRS